MIDSFCIYLLVIRYLTKLGCRVISARASYWIRVLVLLCCLREPKCSASPPKRNKTRANRMKAVRILFLYSKFHIVKPLKINQLWVCILNDVERGETVCVYVLVIANCGTFKYTTDNQMLLCACNNNIYGVYKIKHTIDDAIYTV